MFKGEKKRPKFKPSKLDESTDDDAGQGETANSDEGKAKKCRRNKKELIIHREQRVKPDNLPDGSRFKRLPGFCGSGAGDPQRERSLPPGVMAHARRPVSHWSASNIIGKSPLRP